ncbi:hypothetical protein C6P40_004946 [Pichia californica]|uniref:Uncharacterized protein n=1 Tax=Pichia californica TaxID=460514 RepID=A0A9P6WM07_9ASCO|nr:hypothetical protein C6P42_000574 [[Candida] californica]KAG0689487.1 hypothetical protein C6P40_004946 [[Candida] californica]
MRSLPQPRYSRTRTIQRIFRSIVNLFSTGYISDSSAFAHHTVLDKSSRKTKIRTSRFTGKPTPRHTMVNKLGSKLVSELIDDENLISKVVQNEITGLSENINGSLIVNDINHNSKNGIFSFWKNGEQSII